MNSAYTNPGKLCILDRSCRPRASRGEQKLEQAINERGQSRALGQHQQAAQNQQEDDNRREPPFFADTQKVQEFFNDCQLVHSSFKRSKKYQPSNDLFTQLSNNRQKCPESKR